MLVRNWHFLYKLITFPKDISAMDYGLVFKETCTFYNGKYKNVLIQRIPFFIFFISKLAIKHKFASVISTNSICTCLTFG